MNFAVQVKDLKKELEQKEFELKILHQVVEDVNTTLELNTVLNRINEIAVTLTHADSCLIYLYDKDASELVLRVSKNPHPKLVGRIKLKVGEGLTGWVAKVKKPVVISSQAYNDPRFKIFNSLPEDEYESFLSVPILAQNELIGVINVQHKKERYYPDTQVNLLFTIARFLGNAISQAITYEAVQKKEKQLEVLSKISRTIISDQYLQEMLHLIVTMTAQVMNSKISSIMLLDEKKQELVIAATQSLSEEYKNKPPLKVGQSISGRVVKEKQPITVSDVTQDPEYMYPGLAKKEGIVSMLSVPMMIKDRVIGVINSYTAQEHTFLPEEIDILQAIANQSAVAIETTRLNEEILTAKESLEARKVIEKAKGLLMKELNISEEVAYKKIHRKSMDLRKNMREVAEAIILAYEMKKLTE